MTVYLVIAYWVNQDGKLSRANLVTTHAIFHDKHNAISFRNKWHGEDRPAKARTDVWALDLGDAAAIFCHGTGRGADFVDRCARHEIVIPVPH